MTLASKLDKVRYDFQGDVLFLREFVSEIDKSLAGRMNRGVIRRRFPARMWTIQDRRILKKILNHLERSLDEQMRRTPAKRKLIRVTPDGTLVPGAAGQFVVYSFLTLQYRRFLPEMALTYLVALQEAFVKEYLKLVLLFQKFLPLLLSSDKKITYAEALDHPSITSLRKEIAQREVDELARISVDNMADYLKKRFHCSLEHDFADWAKVREASYRRNLIVHNRGITNKLYCEKTGHKKLGETLTTDATYVLTATDAIINFINFVHTRIVAKL